MKVLEWEYDARGIDAGRCAVDDGGMLRLLLIVLIWVVIFAVNPLVGLAVVVFALAFGVLWCAAALIGGLLRVIWALLTLPFRVMRGAWRGVTGNGQPRCVIMSARCV